jgi:hypothetical protein
VTRLAAALEPRAIAVEVRMKREVTAGQRQ